MTKDHLELVEKSQLAERSGDAASALDLHLAVPAFKMQSRHTQMMMRLAALTEGGGGDALPGWVWARWITYQASRCEDGGSQTGELFRRSLRYVLDVFHQDQLADCYVNGEDPFKVAARVASQSWIFHQFFVHEMRGIELFLDEFVTGQLAEHSGLARSWVGCHLRAYQVGASLPGGRLRVHDPATDTWTEVLDLGARSCAGPQGWALGRLVPSGTDDLLMFESPPLAVSERVAREVAESAAQPWAVLLEALDEGRMVGRHVMREDYELTTDVQELDLLRFGTAPRDLERVTGQLRSGRDEISRAAFRILRRAGEGDIQQADAAYVAAAVLNPRARADARQRLVREGQYDLWLRWAGLVHEPARGLLMQFAEVARVAS